MDKASHISKESSSSYRLGLVMLQNMGHLTHSQNLRRWLTKDHTVEPTWMDVQPFADDIWQKVPFYAGRLSLRARSLVRTALQKEALDCLFYHTETSTLFSLGIMQRVPTIVSLDATPRNFKSIGKNYIGYQESTGVASKLKFEWYRKIFNTAVALVGWSNWVKESLVSDFGIEPDKVTVIPPGIELSQWSSTIKKVRTDNSLKLLFVGAEFTRKGGQVVLEAFRRGLSDRCTLDIVTKEDIVVPDTGVCIHRNLTPNSPMLRQVFADADLFVFPTFADTTAIVIMEAMASGLPVVATNVGGLSEVVEDRVTGFLVPENDPGAIVEAVTTLANDPARLLAMGKAARARAENLFDAEKNYKALVDVMKRCVDKQRHR
jgi:glycosyltransferase involved in cell wall biosynthesis